MPVAGLFALSDKPADEYLTLAGHVADNVAVLQDGTHVGMVRLEGRALSLMDQAEDGPRYAERRRRHSVLRSLIGPGVCIYEHHVCHDHVPEFEHGQFRSRYAERLARDYHGSMQGGLLVRDWLVTVMARPNLLEGLTAKFLGGDPGADAGKVQEVRDRMANILSMLKDYRPKVLGIRDEGGIAFSEIGEAWRLILYCRWAPVPVTDGVMAASVYTDRVICGPRGFEIQSPGRTTYGQMWGIRQYPTPVKPWIFDGLLSSRCRYVMTNSFRFATAAATAEKLGFKKARMLNTGDKTSSLRIGLEEAVDDVQSGRHFMGDHHWSLAIHSDSWEGLQRDSGEIRGILANTSNITAAVEAVGCFPAYWAQLPGAPTIVRARHGSIHGFNFCSFSSLGGFPRGGRKTRWGLSAIRFMTSGNTAHDFEPAVRQVMQMLLIGPPGFGKSVFIGLLAALLEQAIAPKGGLVVILDKDGSNEVGILARGGYYARIREGVSSGMAPLKALSDTPEARSWLKEFIVGLIMADGKGEPPADQRERIGAAIEFMMRLPAGLRSIAGLRCFLDHGDGSTGDRLEEWCRGGGTGWAFDDDEDVIRLDAGVVGIDNTEILPDDKIRVRMPAAAYQLYRIREKIGRGIRGAVFIDEGASYLPDARFAAGFDAFSRDLRKGNGLLAIVVHHPGDLTRHPVGRTLIGNCPTKILFPNPSAKEDDYRDALHCSPGEINAVMQGMVSSGPGTFLVKRPEESFVARAPLAAHPAHIAVLSGTPNTRALWHRIAEEKGTEDPDSIWPEFMNRYQEADV
jgi:type IV secretion system protein VirB4